MLAYHWPQGIITINRYAPLFDIDMHRDNTFQCLQATDNTARTATTFDIFYINFKRHNQSPSLENHRGCNPLLHLYLINAGALCKCDQCSCRQADLSSLLPMTLVFTHLR